MNSNITIGGAKPKATRAVAESIISILAACHDREEALAALAAFQNATSVTNTAITNCNFTGDADYWDVDDTDEEDGVVTLTPLARVLGGIIASAAVGFTLGVVISMASQGRIHANIALDIVFGALAITLAAVAIRAAWQDEAEHRAVERRKATLAKLQRDKGGVR